MRPGIRSSQNFSGGSTKSKTRPSSSLRTDAVEAKKFLTDLTISRMDQVVKMYKRLRNLLISKYTGDIV